MNAIVEADSTLTDRYQTTVPEPVRRALGLKKRDAIHYEVLADGEVRLSRSESNRPDPVMIAFLTLLDNDVSQGLNINRASEDLVLSIQRLVKGAYIDLESPLSPDDE